MPGILPTKVANHLTRFFDNRVDFSNFGRTFTEKGPIGYTRQQLIDRGLIWSAMVLGGVLGYVMKRQLSNHDNNSASMTISIALGVASGFYFSHRYIISPRLENRNRLIQDIAQLHDEALKLMRTLNQIEGLEDLIKQRIEALINYSCSNDERSNATLTLMKRKLGMKEIVAVLEEHSSAYQQGSLGDNECVQFWYEHEIDYFLDPKSDRPNSLGYSN